MYIVEKNYPHKTEYHVVEQDIRLADDSLYIWEEYTKLFHIASTKEEANNWLNNYNEFVDEIPF